jgi:hypothetical protein
MNDTAVGRTKDIFFLPESLLKEAGFFATSVIGPPISEKRDLRTNLDRGKKSLQGIHKCFTEQPSSAVVAVSPGNVS